MGENNLNESDRSETNFDNDLHILDNVYIQVGLVLLYTSIFLVCFVGNLTVIVVLWLQWKRRNVSKFCLGNMAVANLSVSLFCILQNLTIWIFGELMCKLHHFITNLCHSASILILVAISIERYLVLLHPFRCRPILTTRALTLTTLSVWILSAGISLPRFFYFGLVRIQLNENGDFGDICVPIKSMYNSATADTIYFILTYLTPLAAMSAMYLRIGLFLRRSARQRRELDERKRLHVTSSSREHSQACQKRLDGFCLHGDMPTQESYSAPAHLGSIPIRSDPSSQGAIFTLSDEMLLQQNIRDCPSTKGRWKWRKHPRNVLCLASTVELAVHLEGVVRKCSAEQDTVRCKDTVAGPHAISGKFSTVHGQGLSHKIQRVVEGTLVGLSTTSSAFCPILQKRVAVVLKPEAQRGPYRYHILQTSDLRCNQRQKAVKMLVYYVLNFAVLNLPYHVRKLYLNYSPYFDMASDANCLIAPLTFALMYANCALSPILYAFMSKNFWASVRGIFSYHGCGQGERNISSVLLKNELNESVTKC